MNLNNPRFLANEFGLGGRNNAESAQADEIVDVVNDILESKVSLLILIIFQQC